LRAYFVCQDDVGLPHVVSYLHLLGTGHLYNCLKSWGKLYKCQQQDWKD